MTQTYDGVADAAETMGKLLDWSMRPYGRDVDIELDLLSAEDVRYHLRQALIMLSATVLQCGDCEKTADDLANPLKD